MSIELTREECREETELHIANVRTFLNPAIIELSDRSIHHDESKLQDPELDVFRKYTPLLAKLDYGSDEYRKCASEMRPALVHHYANNRHHPEYFKNGWHDMNLVDLLEMVCDWIAATKRHENGDIYTSLEINRKRFKMPAYFVEILKNTVDYIQALEESEGQ